MIVFVNFVFILFIGNKIEHKVHNGYTKDTKIYNAKPMNSNLQFISELRP